MNKNMGTLDRTLRIAVAILLAFLALTNAVTGGLAVAAWIVAAVFLGTSLIGFCPAYRLIGLNTCGKG